MEISYGIDYDFIVPRMNVLPTPAKSSDRTNAETVARDGLLTTISRLLCDASSFACRGLRSDRAAIVNRHIDLAYHRRLISARGTQCRVRLHRSAGTPLHSYPA